MSFSPITSEKRAEVRRLLEQKRPYSEVAQLAGVSRASVYRLAAETKETEEPEPPRPRTAKSHVFVVPGPGGRKLRIRIPDVEPSPPRVRSGEPSLPRGDIRFNISIQVNLLEFADWEPARIAAFFSGIAQVLAAKAGSKE